MQLLALDFDGVISDSAPEAWLVTLRTLAELRPEPFVEKQYSAARQAPVEAIREDPSYRRFVEMMPLGNRAEDFAVAVSLLARGELAKDQSEFDRAFSAVEAGFHERFHERFYQIRRELREGEPERWLSLLGPYPELVALLHRVAPRVRLAIATAKDRESVLRLLARYEVEGLFPDDALVDKSAGRSKRAHLAALAERFQRPFEDITFVDDKVNHLDDVAGLGVRCGLAAWGYNGEREAREARDRGYGVWQVPDLEAALAD